jgi:dTDP-4-dehydrorhamnose reductase
MRCIVIGASGLIGRRFLHAFGTQLAIGTYRARAFKGGYRFDMATDRIETLLDSLKGSFTHALVLGAMADIDACATDPIGTAHVNVEGVIRTIAGLRSRAIIPIFASSDGVYDGSHGAWREDDPAFPMLTYGRQKLEVERYLATGSGSWVGLRLAKVLDAELDDQGVLGPWIKQLAGGQRIRCATDQRFTPIAVDDVVTAIRGLAEVGASGLFNVGGPESLTRIDLLEKLVAAVANERAIAPNIDRCSIRDFPLAEARPFDTSMSIAKLQSVLRFDAESLDSLCRRAARAYVGAMPR